MEEGKTETITKKAPIFGVPQDVIEALNLPDYVQSVTIRYTNTGYATVRCTMVTKLSDPQWHAINKLKECIELDFKEE